MPNLDLITIVADFAAGMLAADAKRPSFVSRKGRVYQPGIGPHGEDRAVELVLGEMRSAKPNVYGRSGQGLPYPSSRQKCDVWIGAPLEWAIEVKMARFFGDNGKPDDTSIKDVLSPFDVHRSAVADAPKLAGAGFPARTAILIYGFDYPAMPLATAMEAFEALASRRVTLTPPVVTPLPALVHPVHARGAVYGWEVALRR